MPWWWVSALSLLLISACAPTPRHLRVIQSTDVHGYWASPSPGQSPRGLRALATLVATERAKGPVLLIDSGDMWSGTLLGDRYEGRAGVQAYNALGYDAAALGNHEFDYGPLGLRRIGDDQPFGALRARLQDARFPILSANLRDRQTNALPNWEGLAASTIVDRGGYRIGIIGATTQGTPEITFPYVGAKLSFEAPAESVIAEAQRLRQHDKVELVFAVVHLGGTCRQDAPAEDPKACDPNTELGRFLKTIPKGLIDAVFAGHTHKRFARWIDGIPVLQAGQYGRHVAMLDLKDGPEGTIIRSLQAPQTLPAETDGDLVRRVSAVLEPYEQEVEQLRQESLGARIARPLVRDRHQSSSLGSWLCDLLLRIHPSREICILNSGGLRSDLPAGTLRYGALYDVMPFGNEVAYMDISGKTLLDIVRRMTAGDHGVMQTSGLKVRYDRGRDHCPTRDRNGNGRLDPGDRDRVVSASLSTGAAIDPARTYRIVTNSFLAGGGDGLGMIVNALPTDAVRVPPNVLPAREQIAAWLREHRPLIHSADKPEMPTPRVVATGESVRTPCASKPQNTPHRH